MLLFETDIWAALSNPFIVSALTLLFAYLGNKALSGAMVKKTNIEGVILTADKIDELSNTIFVLRNSLER